MIITISVSTNFILLYHQHVIRMYINNKIHYIYLHTIKCLIIMYQVLVV